MRISAIHIQDFLSFDEFEWRDLDPKFNVVVGPNGSGKTNLFHALRAMANVIGYREGGRWEEAGHHGAARFRITVDVDFTGEWERELITAFAKAAFAQGPSMPEQVQFAELIHRNLSSEAFSWLFSGRITVLHEGPTYWSGLYESRSDDVHYHVRLRESTSILFLTPEPRTNPTFYDAWKQLPGEDKSRIENQLRNSRGIGPTPYVKQVLQHAATENFGLQFAVYPPSPPSFFATHREFEHVSGISFQSERRSYDFREMLHIILTRAVLFTDNIRGTPGRTFSAAQVSSPAAELTSASELALHLFQLKNGGVSQQRRWQTVGQTFGRLTGHSFDVSILPHSSNTPNEEVELGIQVTRSEGLSVPLEWSGAGIGEALFLSAIMGSASSHLVLLDEPAANLHPTVQTSLRDAVNASGENQFIITTHSPALVPAEALETISRFDLNGGATRRSALRLGPLGRRRHAAISQELRGSTDARALLFSRGVLLVEGDTELGALPVWYERGFGKSLDQDDLVVYAVGGDRNFEKYCLVLEQFGVPWAILCDGPAIGEGTPSIIAAALRKAGLSGVPDNSITAFAERCRKLEPCGVFTLARSPKDEFEQLPVIKSNWPIAAKQVGPKSKVRIARFIAENNPPPPEVSDLLQQMVGHFSK